MPSLAAKAKYVLIIAGSRGSKASSSSSFQPRAGKAGRPKEGIAKPAREGKSRQGRKVPSSRLGTLSQMTLISETIDIEEPQKCSSQVQPFACVCVCV